MTIRFRNGVSLLHRDSAGALILAGFHPPTSPTWHWFVSWQKYRGDETRRIFRVSRDQFRTHQWHDRLHILRLGYLMLGRQDFHLRNAATTAE